MRFLRALVTLGIALAGYLAPLLLVGSPFGEVLSQNPTILFIGDFSPLGHGTMVAPGVQEALLLDENGPRVHPIHLPEGSSIRESIAPRGAPLNEVHDRARREIVAAISQFNIVGIISASSSKSAAIGLEIAESFNLPILLTVATTDGLLTGFEEVALRLLPSDAHQAEAIASWVSARRDSLEFAANHPPTIRDGSADTATVTTAAVTPDYAVAVVFDPEVYGRNLESHLVGILGDTSVIPFEVGTTEEMTGIIERARELAVTDWIFLGYSKQAREFYAKLRRLGFTGRVVMSDGAYGSWMSEVQHDSVFLAFPSTRPGSEQAPPMSGYAVFGHDAGRLFRQLPTGPGRRVVRNEVLAFIKNRVDQLSGTSELIIPYEFNEAGENVRIAYEIRPVASYRPPADSVPRWLQGQGE